MKTKRSFDNYRMSDEMWQRMQPLLPAYETSPQGGRPRANLRSVADAIFYRMRTGCQWNAIPPELAAGSTAHDYYQQWTEQDIFEDLWRLAMEEYDQKFGLDWEWQSIDGAMTKAPLGGEKTGKNPTDRGKSGVKRSLQTEGSGIPVGVAIAGANVHDKHLVEATIESTLEMSSSGQADAEEIEEHLSLDKGYEELRKLAAAKMVQEKPGQTLQATALVHEAYLRLVDGEKAQHWDSRGHFFVAAAESMRRILVETARRKASLRAGGHMRRVDLEDAELSFDQAHDQLLDLDDALEKLAGENPEAADLAKLRLFAGLSVDEAAKNLGVSRRTGFHRWTYARAFLQIEIGEDSQQQKN
jgi:RNA polymerase sigma factor (TIGR02999 family)